MLAAVQPAIHALTVFLQQSIIFYIKYHSVQNTIEGIRQLKRVGVTRNAGIPPAIPTGYQQLSSITSCFSFQVNKDNTKRQTKCFVAVTYQDFLYQLKILFTVFYPVNRPPSSCRGLWIIRQSILRFCKEYVLIDKQNLRKVLSRYLYLSKADQNQLHSHSGLCCSQMLS